MPLFQVNRTTGRPALVEASDIYEAMQAYLSDGTRSAEYVTSITIVFEGDVVRNTKKEDAWTPAIPS